MVDGPPRKVSGVAAASRRRRHRPLHADGTPLAVTPEVLRAALLDLTATAPAFYVMVTEAQAGDLASGYVPQAVMAMCTAMLDWRDQDRRRAKRPVPR